MARHISLLILLAFAACSRGPSVTAPPETRAERLAILDRIAEECQVSRAMMELVGEDELRLKPRPDEAYERVDCVLQRIDQLNLPSGPGAVGFVGNEAPASGASNALRDDTNAMNAVAAAEANNAQAD